MARLTQSSLGLGWVWRNRATGLGGEPIWLWRRSITIMKSCHAFAILGLFAISGCSARRPAELPAQQKEPSPAVASDSRAGEVTEEEPPVPAEVSSTAASDRRDLADTSEFEAALREFREGELELAALGRQPEPSGGPGAFAAAPHTDEDEGEMRAGGGVAGRARAEAAARPEGKPAAKKAAPPASAPPERDERARCVIACKALGSMRRAASRMCDLVGDADAGCVDVRGRLARSEARVSTVCPGCASGG